MPVRHTVGQVNDLKDGECSVVELNGYNIAIFRSDGQYFAIDDFCPHMGASLAGGNVEGGIVTCPWHAWRFRLCDGAWADNPRIKTRTFPIHIVGEDIQVEVPDQPPGLPPGGAL